MTRRSSRGGPKPNRQGLRKVRRASPLAKARDFSNRRRGRRAEVLAGLWLMLKSYRIMGFRVPTSLGEIDIAAAKHRTLAIIEVKHRTDLATALEAVCSAQRDYLRREGRQISATTIALAPWRLPYHIPNAWPDDAGAR